MFRNPTYNSTALSGLCEYERALLTQILDLFAEESWRRVYAGELEVRTTRCAHHRLGGSLFGPRHADLGLAVFRLVCGLTST